MTMGPGPKYGGGTGWVPAESKQPPGRPRSGVVAEKVSEVASSDYPYTQLQQET